MCQARCKALGDSFICRGAGKTTRFPWRSLERSSGEGAERTPHPACSGRGFYSSELCHRSAAGQSHPCCNFTALNKAGRDPRGFLALSSETYHLSFQLTRRTFAPPHAILATRGYAGFHPAPVRAANTPAPARVEARGSGAWKGSAALEPSARHRDCVSQAALVRVHCKSHRPRRRHWP